MLTTRRCLQSCTQSFSRNHHHRFLLFSRRPTTRGIKLNPNSFFFTYPQFTTPQLKTAPLWIPTRQFHTTTMSVLEQSSTSSTATQLDKTQFQKQLTLVALSIPSSSSALFMTALRGHLFVMKKMKAIIEHPDSPQDKRLVLLNQRYKSLNDLPESLLLFVKQQLPSIENTTTATTEEPVVREHNVTIGYDQMTSEEVLRCVLPPNSDIPSSFEQVGHIAHLNLRDDLLPYKHTIGQVILDKSPMIKTVVNKIGTIESVYREAQLEVLAGTPDFNVEAKEHGIRFKFNFSEVYWNSRLASEHQRVLKYVKKEDIVCDMMAGVGPFAVPAAKKIGCRVHANDLNPKSYEYMTQNTKLNKVDKLVTCYNMDGRDFVKMLVSKGVEFNHVLMNLPGSAVEFLDVFVNLFPASYAGKMPMIHVYTFIRGDPRTEADKMVEDAKRTVEKYLSITDPNTIDYTEVFDVRDVAPKKNMFCVSFQLPESVGLQNANKRKLDSEDKTNMNDSTGAEDGQQSKKIKI